MDVAGYVARVREPFHQRLCVQGPFRWPDARLAEWHGAGVALQTVRRAVLLGSVLKSMTLIDRLDGDPVRALRYFESLLGKVLGESLPASYWRHFEPNLDRCEQSWRDQPAAAPGRARPDSEQASLPGRGPDPAPSIGQEGDGETG